MFRKIGIMVTVIMTAILISGCSRGFVSEEPGKTPASSLPASGIPASGLVQSNTGGGVTIEVKWLTERKEALVFDVAMDTHSVDLDQYDLKELALLQDSQGKEYRPTSWESALGGHHRRGILTFAIPDSLSQKTTRYLKLTIRDVAGVKERVLQWER